MKRTYILLLWLIIFAFISCTKEDNDSSNYIFDGIKYKLTYGSIQTGDTNDLHNPNTYNFKILVADKGIKYDETLKTHTGTGNYLYFNLVSTNGTNISEGSYAFDGFSSGDSLTFDEGYIGINHDIASNTAGEKKELKTGIINLRRNGNIFIITFELYVQGDPDKAIKGFYNGFLNELDYLPE